MPQLVFKGVSEKEMPKITANLAQNLGEIIGCPGDWLIFEHSTSVFYDANGKTELFPIVEVIWYDRPKELQDAVTQAIADELLPTHGTVQVIFSRLSPDIFYEFEK